MCACAPVFVSVFCVYDNVRTVRVCVGVCCSQTDTTVYKRVLAHPAALCEIESIQLKNTGARFYRQGDIHVKSVCLLEFPVVRYVCACTACAHHRNWTGYNRLWVGHSSSEPSGNYLLGTDWITLLTLPSWQNKHLARFVGGFLSVSMHSSEQQQSKSVHEIN